MTIHQTLDLAVQHHRAKRLADAEKLYRQILAAHPNHPDALHLLGMLAFDVGQHSIAAELVTRAISINPKVPEYHHNLGLIQLAQGRFEDAVRPFERALRLKPDYVDAHFNLARTLHRLGQMDQAVESYRLALRLKPISAEMCQGLGIIFLDLQLFDDAAAALQLAIRLKPDDAIAHNNLGKAIRAQGNAQVAIDAYREALKLKPDLAEAHNNLANVLRQQGNLDEAIAEYRLAIQYAPDLPTAHSNLAGAMSDAAQLEQAIEFFRKAMALQPADPVPHSNLVYTLHFHPGCDAESLRHEHHLWNQRHAEPLAKFIRPHSNNRDPDRPLRIGYVGADFRDHCQSFFTVPLFSNHDRSQFQVFCYANVLNPDAVTRRLQMYANHWRNVVGVPDEKVAQAVRDDRIDILVDLTLHMMENRLLVFAYKPAPVQVTWLGYPGSTGLQTMDYRISDPYLDPPGSSEEFYSEETIRLQDCFWCYDPLTNESHVNPLPALSGHPVTFGCLNNFCKVNDGVLELWSRVLAAVPNSRLMLLSHLGSHRDRTMARFRELGIDPTRLEFVPKQPRRDYLDLYHRIDIGLDTFPYNGHTTSLDSFWMGVPVVTLVGTMPVARAGLCLAVNLGLSNLVAETKEQFVQIAVDLAGDLPKLAELRQILRPRMQASPLMDGQRFARNMEAAYRDMWRRWCAAGTLLDS